MAPQTLTCCNKGLQKANIEIRLRSWSQEELAFQASLSTRTSVGKFFQGKPVEQKSFIKICQALNLDWQEIAGLLDNLETELVIAQPVEVEKSHIDIDALVQEIGVAQMKDE
ncbi:MAG: hypothetical protein DCF19_23320 [Pseudanabaena frigida]|uniref:HTH cro/C1-type domain-containing protein n=1 Tax=Pseudanabaena frigida TaxID=945775 RepID=A0A2W4VS37_9CYAN|nr:MAG: hypothetical protein DCF19_23320 [Pseudanabaena frigida]